VGQFHGWTEFPLGSLTLSRTPFRFDLHASFAYVGNQPLTSVDPLGLCIIQGVEFDDEDWPCQSVLWGIGIEVAGGHLGGGMGGGWAGGFPGGRRGGGGGRIGGRYPNGETLGLPTGLNLKPASLLELLGLSPAAPGTGCDFGVCVPIGSGYLAGAGGEGTPESPWIFYVVVWSPLAANNGTTVCGDFICDSSGKQIAVAPPEIRGIHPTNIEFDILLSGFYLSDINTNPLLRIGPGYVKGGTKIIRVVSGGPGLPWWWHIWDGPRWPF